jgi:hypothetical protein
MMNMKVDNLRNLDLSEEAEKEVESIIRRGAKIALKCASVYRFRVNSDGVAVAIGRPPKNRFDIVNILDRINDVRKKQHRKQATHLRLVILSE